LPIISYADLDTVKNKKIGLLKKNAGDLIEEYFTKYRQRNINMGLEYFIEQTDSINGDGTSTTLTINLSKLFAKPSTVIVKQNGTQIGSDDGNGNIVNDTGTTIGSVTYGNYDIENRTTNAGSVSITFDTAPAETDVIEVTYRINLEQFMKYFIDVHRKAVDVIENNIKSAPDVATVDGIDVSKDAIKNQITANGDPLVYINF